MKQGKIPAVATLRNNFRAMAGEPGGKGMRYAHLKGNQFAKSKKTTTVKSRNSSTKKETKNS